VIKQKPVHKQRQATPGPSKPLTSQTRVSDDGNTTKENTRRSTRLDLRAISKPTPADNEMDIDLDDGHEPSMTGPAAPRSSSGQSLKTYGRSSTVEVRAKSQTRHTTDERPSNIPPAPGGVVLSTSHRPLSRTTSDSGLPSLEKPRRSNSMDLRGKSNSHTRAMSVDAEQEMTANSSIFDPRGTRALSAIHEQAELDVHDFEQQSSQLVLQAFPDLSIDSSSSPLRDRLASEDVDMQRVHDGTDSIFIHMCNLTMPA
jgi:hypothetical protein